MILILSLFSLAWCISFVFGSCDWTYCAAQFCPPSVGDVGYCLCYFNNQTDIVETDIAQCVDEQCLDAPDSVFDAQHSAVYACCGEFVNYNVTDADMLFRFMGRHRGPSDFYLCATV